MRNRKSKASAEEWRELVELVDKFCNSISDLKAQVGKLETKITRLESKRAASVLTA